MVIISSDSNNTLVSLGRSSNRLKRVGSLELLQQASTQYQKQVQEPVEFVATNLYLPNDEDDEDWAYSNSNSSYDDEEDTDDSSFFSCQAATLPRDALYLPKQQQQAQHDDQSSSCDYDNNNTLHVDQCFSYLPSLVESCDALHAKPPTCYSSQSAKQRLVYVGQGEVGHAVPLQTDVILSDRATTCHILMLYSTSSQNVPLASCAHLDGTDYNLATLFEKHAQHHRHHDSLELDVHIMGGYTALADQSEDSSTRTSRELSHWIVYELARLAQEHAAYMTCTLQTAAISSLNTTAHGTPWGRGLAMNVRTGQVWLAQMESATELAPAFVRRQAQLWFRGSDKEEESRELILIHSETSNILTVPALTVPVLNPELLALVSLPDEVLLQYTSTSPRCEQDDFCFFVRETIDFWQQYSGQTLAAQSYKRSSSSSRNQWMPLHG